MSLRVAKKSGLRMEYEFSLTKNQIEGKIEALAIEIAPTVKMDGFRAGKVPLDVIKKNRMGILLERAILGVFREELQEEIKKNNFELAVDPVWDNEPLEKMIEPSDFKTKVVFDLEPGLPQINYSKIELEYPDVNPSDEEVEEELKSLVSALGKLKEVTDQAREVENGDVASIKFEGFVDEKPFEGGFAEQYNLKIGSKSFIGNFEEQIIGHKVGEEFDVKVKFPEDYHVAELSSKDAVFKVKLLKILEVEHPPMDKDLAKLFDCETIDDLRQKTKDAIIKRLSSRIRGMSSYTLFNTIVENNSFGLPESILNSEIEKRKTESKEIVSDNKLDRKTDKEIEVEAKTALMTYYLVKGLIKENKLTATDKELGEFLSFRVPYQGENTKLIRDYYLSDPKLRQRLKDGLMEDKLVEILLARFTVNKKILTKEKAEEYIKALMEDPKKTIKIRKKALFG